MVGYAVNMGFILPPMGYIGICRPYFALVMNGGFMVKMGKGAAHKNRHRPLGNNLLILVPLVQLVVTIGPH